MLLLRVDLMKSIAVDESLSSMNQQFSSRKEVYNLRRTFYIGRRSYDSIYRKTISLL